MDGARRVPSDSRCRPHCSHRLGLFLKQTKLPPARKARQSKNRRLSRESPPWLPARMREPGGDTPQGLGGSPAHGPRPRLLPPVVQDSVAAASGGQARNPGQPTSPGHLGPQSILGLERTHPKAGITWEGWSQTTCHVSWTFMPKVTELTQKTRQRKSPNASEARRPVWPQSGSRLATHPGPGLPHRPGRPPCLLGHPASLPGHPPCLLGRPPCLPRRPPRLPGHPASLPGHPPRLLGRPASLPGHTLCLPGRPPCLPGRPPCLPGCPASLPGCPLHLLGCPASPPVMDTGTRRGLVSRLAPHRHAEALTCSSPLVHPAEGLREPRHRGQEQAVLGAPRSTSCLLLRATGCGAGIPEHL